MCVKIFKAAWRREIVNESTSVENPRFFQKKNRNQKKKSKKNSKTPIESSALSKLKRFVRARKNGGAKVHPLGSDVKSE